MELKKLFQEKERHVSEMRALLSAAEKSGKDFDSEQESRYQALERSLEGVDRQIKLAEAEAQVNQPVTRAVVPQIIRDQAAQALPTMGYFGQEAVKAIWGKPPVNRSVYDDIGSREFIEFVGSGRYERRFQGEGIGTQGGYTVPTGFSNEIMSAGFEESVAAGRCRVIKSREGTGGMSIPLWDELDHSTGVSGLNVTWSGEGVTSADQDAKLRTLELTPSKLLIRTDISPELEEDSGVDFAAQLKTKMSQAIAYGLDDSILTGNGVNKCYGLTEHPSTLTVTRTTASTIVWADVANMLSRLYPLFFKGAVWCCSPSALGNILVMTDASATASYLWTVNAPFNAQVPMTLAGLPLLITEKLPALGQQADLVLANFSMYALLLHRELRMDRTNAARWAEDLLSYRLTLRANGVPLLSGPITPKRGTQQLSWAVMLV